MSLRRTQSHFQPPPTPLPTSSPVTPQPTSQPTPQPTAGATPGPTFLPTTPTKLPTSNPTPLPTQPVTSEPTPNPTAVPTNPPTNSPTPPPTVAATPQPTDAATSSSDPVKNLVPEASGYDLVYDLDIPTNPVYKNAKPDYSIDNHQSVSGFNRIAYYLKLDGDWVWISMDKFTTDARKIGVPCHHLSCGDGQSRTVFQQMVTNVNVVSNVDGLSGTGLSGNIEVSLRVFLCNHSFQTRLLTDLLASISVLAV